MKGFSPVMFIAGIIFMATGVLLAGDIASILLAGGLGNDILSIFFPAFPFIFGLVIFGFSIKREE